MPFWRWPLWAQLLILWPATIVAAVALVWLDFRRAPEFVWVVPFPGWRAVLTLPRLFVWRPLLAAGLSLVPLAALATVALIVVRLAPVVRRALPVR